MYTTIIEKLLFEEESSTLDFKREQYKFKNANALQKSELLKDVLAFTNAWRRTDAYILIGVEEVKGGKSKILGVKKDLDDAQLQQFVNSKTQRPITFDYKSIVIKGKKIGVIRIPVQSRPIYLKKDYGKLKRNVVYIRRGSSTAEAEPDEVAKLGTLSPSIHQIQPLIRVEFAENKERIRQGLELNIEETKLLIPDEKEIPDYEESKRNFLMVSLGYTNRNFYRDLVNYYFWKYICKPMAFYILNDSDVPALGIKIELFTKKSELFGFLKESQIPDEPLPTYAYPRRDMTFLSEQIVHKSDLDLTETSDKWIVEIDIPRLQPKKSYFTNHVIYFYSFENIKVDLNVSIYSDTLSTPLKSKLLLKSRVYEKKGDLSSIIKLHYDILQKKRSND